MRPWDFKFSSSSHKQSLFPLSLNPYPTLLLCCTLQAEVPTICLTELPQYVPRRTAITRRTRVISGHPMRLAALPPADGWVILLAWRPVGYIWSQARGTFSPSKTCTPGDNVLLQQKRYRQQKIKQISTSILASHHGGEEGRTSVPWPVTPGHRCHSPLTTPLGRC